MAVGDGAQLVVVGGLAEDVDGDDADGARRDRPPRRPQGRRVQMSGRTSAKTGVAPVQPHRVTGRREGVVGDDDLVAGAGAEDVQAEVQGGAAVARGQGVRGTGDLRREPRFERLAGRAGTGKPSRLEDGTDGLELLLTDCGLTEGDRLGQALPLSSSAHDHSWRGLIYSSRGRDRHCREPIRKEPMPKHVIIIGGGIVGLAVAERASRQGHG